MTDINTSLTSLQAAYARAQKARKAKPNDPATLAAVAQTRAALAEGRLALHIAREVAEAPDLSMRQRSRLALLLSPSAA